MTERVLIIGTGLIGGSLGMALRAAGIHVTGADASPEVARRAIEVGAADDVATVAGGLAGVDVAVIATPVGQIVPTIADVARFAPDGVVVTDVGSAKRPIVAEAERLLGPARPFVGGHPMAGSERDGIEAARADLFDGCLWILTPTEATDPAAYKRVHGFVERAGARVTTLPPDDHDRLVALVSHLPHVLASALMDLAGAEEDDRAFRAAAGSFRDMTRIAGANPRVWRDIFAANRIALRDAVDAFAERLASFRDALDREDWEAVGGLIDRARTARQRLPLKGARGPMEPMLVEVPVRDRAGVLAEITTALSDAGVNIEDLRVEHEGAGGLVLLVLDGREAADRAVSLLTARGMHPTARLQ